MKFKVAFEHAKVMNQAAQVPVVTLEVQVNVETVLTPEVQENVGAGDEVCDSSCCCTEKLARSGLSCDRRKRWTSCQFQRRG